MVFKDVRCPVCGVPFDDGDDVVVCPECGTPHHRICFERLGKCVNDEKHDDSFNWNEEKKDGTSFSICKFCGAKNPSEAIFCSSCSHPLTNEESTEGSNNTEQKIPFSDFNRPNGMPFVINDFNPNNVIDKDEEIAEGVTAGDCQDFVKNNSFYYLPVFKLLKKFNKGRFNFSAAIFSGAWFLYRKMYLLGGIFVALMGLCIFTENFFFESFYNTFMSISETLDTTNSLQIVNYALDHLDTNELLLFLLPTVASALRIVIMIVCGVIANRQYYKHCVKNVKAVKDKNPANLSEALADKGGTNMIPAIVVGVCYIAFQIISNMV